MFSLFTKGLRVRVVPILTAATSNERYVKYDVKIRVSPMRWRTISQYDSFVDAINYVDNMEKSLRIKRVGAILRSAKEVGESETN